MPTVSIENDRETIHHLGGRGDQRVETKQFASGLLVTDAGSG